MVTGDVFYVHTYDLSTLGAHKMHTVHARCAIVHIICRDHISAINHHRHILFFLLLTEGIA